MAHRISKERLAQAKAFVGSLEDAASPYVRRVERGRFVRAVLDGSFPLEGIRFVHRNHYHLIMNDMGNLNLYVAKARTEEEMLFFHFMAAEEKNHLESLFLLARGLGMRPEDLRASEPNSACLLRTNYFSRLAEYGTPGEIALAILLNFPVWAAGAKNEALGLRRHYGMGKVIPGSEGRRDTDILDRFASATRGFRDQALRIIARDLTDRDAAVRMRRVGMWSVRFEEMVWESYFREGLKASKSTGVLRRVSAPDEPLVRSRSSTKRSALDGFERTEKFVTELEAELSGHVETVTRGPFVRGVQDGTFPIEGLRFFVEQTYHLVMNDMGNLSVYVSRARSEAEVNYFLFMTVAEKMMLDSLYLLVDAVGIDRAELRRSQPDINISHRTNFFTRLALYNLPGEVALAILLNFPVWAGGARRVSAGMKRNYGLGKKVKTSARELLDTDVLDRFSKATKGARDMAIKVISSDLTDEASERRMRRVGRLAVEYEAMVWDSYFTEGVKRQTRKGRMG